MTATETRVSAELAYGKTPTQIGEVLDSCMNTVRTHLGQLLLKTGTSRQAELISFVIRIAG